MAALLGAGLQLFDEFVQGVRGGIQGGGETGGDRRVGDLRGERGEASAVEAGHSGVAFDTHLGYGAGQVIAQGGVQGLQEIGYLTQGGCSGLQAFRQRGIVAADVAAHIQKSGLPHRVVFQRAQFLKGKQLALQEKRQHLAGKPRVRV